MPQRPRGTVRFALAAALVSSFAPATLLTSAPPASAASLAMWERMAQCESSGDWTVVNPEGPYYGGLQIMKPTWDAYNGREFAEYPHQATKKEQITVAERILRGSGAGQWGSCARQKGLVNDGVDPYPRATPPVTRVTGPEDRGVLSGTVTLSASVAEEEGKPAGAAFFVDGRAVGTASGPGPAYSVSLDTTALAEGPHTVTARAVDDAGRTGPTSPGAGFFVANRGTAGQTTGDFDGDGKADLAILYGYDREGEDNHTALWTLRSTGRGSFAAPVKAWDNLQAGSGSWNWADSKVTAGDFDGDGRTDIAVLYDEGQDDTKRNRTALWTFTSNGPGFDKPVKRWRTTQSWDWKRSKPVAADFDGDGRADVGILYDEGRDADGDFRTAFHIAYATADGVREPRRVWDNDDRTTGSWNWQSSKPVAADFNGDGKADLGILYNEGRDAGGDFRTAFHIGYGTADAITRPKRAWDNNDRTTGSWNWQSSKPVAADFNGDGKADLGILYKEGKDRTGSNRTAFHIGYGRADGINAPKRAWDNNDTTTGSWNADAAKPAAGDFDGDGKADLGVLYNKGQDKDGKNEVALHTFDGRDDAVSRPVKVWDNSASTSWNWYRSDLG
ncbi:transglycosylase family protein [Streptomyces mobaraensis NBRC 13819 = DSM 40847]|uniref:FG-GAP-like repeat-containing protein n=1 Tax=Streptomyces mobaraensis TaxID=35621 RepID=UPI000346DA94|nr:FG-GAP-like repeat-containing protein [Streptomyces mobaraensis]QTT76612.1 transglycosylase family protein [Streptomyces mobaraensis NBRC 13819 = DSM 40847]